MVRLFSPSRAFAGILAYAALSIGAQAAGANLSVVGTWALIVAGEDLAVRPGLDIPVTFESRPGQISLGVSGTAGIGARWRIDVRRANLNWPRELRLFVRVTDPGMGPGVVDGDDAYREVLQTDQPVLVGAGDRSSVAVQLKLVGMSLKIAPNTYSTSVMFKLVNLP